MKSVMYVRNSNVSHFKEIVGTLKCFLLFLYFYYLHEVQENLTSDKMFMNFRSGLG